ncbi:Calycin-like protein [Bipolaris maydis]|nr:calycin-like protein [Bipolaris maydis]KAJ6194062.1 Calycin-like protein [Bipolaris maydis]KAJ6277893.1 calycin-like protein [Bipolaris maydis]
MGLEGILNKRVQYTYTQGLDWSFEIWYRSDDRVVYRVRTGPLEGRVNYVRAWYQEIILERLYKVSWLEETGTVVSQTIDLEEKKIWTFAAFSKGHHENREMLRHPKMTHLDSWRELAKIGIQTDRHCVPHEGVITQVLEGPGSDLPVIEDSWPVL